MAGSVSKINVLVGANTSQLTAGMQQASRSVHGFQSSANNAQMAMTQLAFAADDAMTVFGQTGFAGSLRASANNLTMMAASLFGIKGLMISVAAVGAAQLAMSFMKTGAGSKKAAKDVDELSGALSRQLDFENKMAAAHKPRMDTTSDAKSASALVTDLRAARDSANVQLIRSRRAREDVARNPGRLLDKRTKEELAVRDTTLVDLDKRIKSEEQALKIAEQELKTQKEIAGVLESKAWKADRAAKAIERQRDAANLNQPFITSEMRSVMAGQINDIDAEIAQLRESMMPSLSMGSMFGMMPNANAMGSSGAISAISASQMGPQNARDAGPSLQRETNRILSRIEQLEKDKKFTVEAIGL